MKISSAILSFDISTRRKRRIAISFIIELLEMIYHAEHDYKEQLPIKLHGSKSYTIAEDAIVIFDAINILWSVYNE
jgi:hypothetical protein